MNMNNKQVLKKIKYASLTLVLLSSGAQASNWFKNLQIFYERKIERPCLRMIEDIDKYVERQLRPPVNNQMSQYVQDGSDHMEDFIIFSKRCLGDTIEDAIRSPKK